jgi:opacity protein-like surface antigen
MKLVVVAVLAAIGFAVLPNGAKAQSTDPVLQRLDALEKENAALRDRVRRLEVSKQRAASLPPETPAAPLVGPARLAAKAGPGTEADPASVVSWTGFYVGAHGGYASGGLLPPCCAGQGGAIGAPNVTLAGGFGGVQAGYNYQFAPHWLSGVEQDISFGKISGSQSQPLPNPTINITTNYSGTVRERFGYIWNRILFYETAGIAWADNKVGLQFQDPTIPSVSETHLQFGVALGAGMEWAIDSNLSVKVEYLYSYITKEQEFAGTANAGLAGWPLSTVRAGANWRFN